MQSVTDSSYTGTVIVCTSAVAVLNWELGVWKYLCVHGIGAVFRKGAFGVKVMQISCYVYFNFLCWF
jgi:hypothetical protein